MTEQTTVKAGWLARSLAGHDKGQWYVIVRADETGIYVADGRLRKAGNPKRKNPRHLQVCKREDLTLPDGAGLSDLRTEANSLAIRSEQIRYILRQFEKQQAQKISNKKLEE